jgi:molybdate transport system substrate-binding protein
VFAAASLTDSFEDIGTAFEDANDGTSVAFNFAGSPALRTQLQEGADADVYASADTNNMQQALDASLVVDDGEMFTRNRLVVIVPADNPANVTALQDLSKDGLKLVLAAEDVPVGRYAQESIAKMQAEGSFGETFSDDVLANVVSNEPNVKAVVTKVQLGEADAGIVYVTDVTAEVEADISTIDIPDDLNVVAVYPIAVTTNAGNPETAQAFIDFVLSGEGQAILAGYGFQPIE